MTDTNDSKLQQTNRDESGHTKKSSRGCCFYGCLVTFLLVTFVVVGGGLSLYWWLKGQVTRYTADAPADLPVIELSDEELAEIQDRVDRFKETIEGGGPPEDLVLTADEINALITKDEEMRGKVYVTIQDGEVSGEISIPTDALPGGKGRYFNASATFDVSLDNGVLIVTLADAEVKGEQIPKQILEGIAKENLAKEAYKDPEVAATLGRIESISIEDDKIVLKPRKMAEQSKEPTEPDEATEPSQPEGVDGAPDDAATSSSDE